MVVWVRLELTTSRLSIECSNQLSYQTILARGERFELPDPLLGLQFSRLVPSTARPSPHMVPTQRFELWTLKLRVSCSTKLSYTGDFQDLSCNAPDVIRTRGLYLPKIAR